MQKKKMLMLSVMCSAMLLLTGCGAKLYDLSEEESDLIAAYAAEMIAKYNIYQNDGAISFDTSLLDVEEETEEIPDSEESGDTESTQEPQNPSGGGNSSEGTDRSASLAEALSLPETVTIGYEGYVLSDYYLDEYFSMNADPGKTYLIAKFTLSASADTTLDFASVSPIMTMASSEGNVTQETSYLDHDLSNYADTIVAGGTEELIVLFEISKETAESVGEVSYLLTINGENISINL